MMDNFLAANKKTDQFLLAFEFLYIMLWRLYHDVQLLKHQSMWSIWSGWIAFFVIKFLIHPSSRLCICIISGDWKDVLLS